MPTQPYMIALLFMCLVHLDLSFVKSVCICLEFSNSKNALVGANA